MTSTMPHKTRRTWDEDTPRCANCETRRFRRASRVFCVRCNSLVLQIERLERCTFKRRGRYPRVSDSSKHYLVRHYRERLAEYAKLERGINEPVSAMQLEGLLYPIARACRSHFSIALHSVLHESFDERSRQVLYFVLLDLIEHIPRRTLKKFDLTPPPGPHDRYA